MDEANPVVFKPEISCLRRKANISLKLALPTKPRRCYFLFILAACALLSSPRVCLAPEPQEGFKQSLLKTKIWTAAHTQAQDQTCGKTTDRHGMAVDSPMIKAWS